MILTKYLFNFSVRLTEQSVTVGSITLRFVVLGQWEEEVCIFLLLLSSRAKALMAPVFRNRCGLESECVFI